MAPMLSYRAMVKGAWRLFDTNPVVFTSWIMGITAICVPIVVVPIRSALGFRVNQYTKINDKDYTHGTSSTA